MQKIEEIINQFPFEVIRALIILMRLDYDFYCVKGIPTIGDLKTVCHYLLEELIIEVNKMKKNSSVQDEIVFFQQRGNFRAVYDPHKDIHKQIYLEFVLANNQYGIIGERK